MGEDRAERGSGSSALGGWLVRASMGVGLLMAGLLTLGPWSRRYGPSGPISDQRRNVIEGFMDSPWTLLIPLLGYGCAAIGIWLMIPRRGRSRRRARKGV